MKSQYKAPDKEQPISSFETDLILLALPTLDFTKTKRTKAKAKNQSDASYYLFLSSQRQKKNRYIKHVQVTSHS